MLLLDNDFLINLFKTEVLVQLWAVSLQVLNTKAKSNMMPAVVEVDKEENPCFQNLPRGQTWDGVKQAVWSGHASAQVP